jgi:hypothetical protein
MSVLWREETRLYERSGAILVVLGAAHDWQPLEPERVRHLLRPDGLAVESLPGESKTHPGASTPPQNGKPTSIAQIAHFA